MSYEIITKSFSFFSAYSASASARSAIKTTFNAKIAEICAEFADHKICPTSALGNE